MSIEPFDFTYTLTSQSEENEVLNALGKGRKAEFEPKSYFFTESTVAAQSNAEGAYGPDFVSTNTKFNITTQFELANKKAYAVTSGQVLIVPQSGDENESKVNVFIKPLQNVDVGVQIKYYVYRGLKKELFINSSNNILPKSSANTPFMAKVWADLISLNELTEPLPQIPASLFGFNTTEADTNSLDVKFFNTYDITSTDEHKVYNLPVIEAGQYFGDFKDNKGGFEIVLNDGFYYQEKSDTGFQFDLKYAKAEKAVFDIADIAGNPNISEKIYRENVQKFLDPAAFYGAHITEKEKGEIKVVDNDVKYNTKADIYSNIVSKFFNKYKCYIYLQCNKGRSFNFDETLGENPLKMGVAEALEPSSYKTNGWPIIINEFEQTHTEDENEKRKGVNNLSLQLKLKTENKNVTLYNTFGNCVNEKIEGNFLDKKALVNETDVITQDYTNNVNYRLINNYPLNNNSLISKNIATFIYVNHEEEEVAYFNNNFGPVEINHLVKVNNQFTSKNAQKTITQKKRIKTNSIDGGSSASNFHFSTIPYSGTSSQPQDDLFKIYTLKKIDFNFKENPLKKTTSADIKYNKIKTNDDYGLFEYGDKNYKIWKGEINDGGKPIKTLQLINFEDEGNVKNYTQLGLTTEDYNKVIYDSITNKNTNHIPESYTNIYFNLRDVITTDNSSVFKKYELGLRVEKYFGIIAEYIYPSLENIVYVYTVDGHYFFTEQFSEKFDFVEEFADANIIFRPKSSYKGEFGFDWMRKDEDNEADYESSIVGGYGFSDKREAFQALKKEYFSLTTRNNLTYYIPYLNIYRLPTITDLITDKYPEAEIRPWPNNIIPPNEVNLISTITIDKQLSKLELDYDTDLFQIETIFPLDLSPGKRDFNIKILCKKEFKIDQYIKILAHSQKNGESPTIKFAGAIKVCKNTIENRSKIKIALFKVLTDINNDLKIEEGEFSQTEIDTLKKVLYQANIYADIKGPYTLDLTGRDNKFKIRAYYNDAGQIYTNPTSAKNYDAKQDDLKEAVGSVFDDCFRVFAFSQGTTEDNLGGNGEIIEGNVQSIGIHSACLYAGNNPRHDYSLTHEVCHGLGLWHTFTSGDVGLNQKYIYPLYNDVIGTPNIHIDDATNNIMSYSPLQTSLWHWQWNIMKDNIKNI